ncbi:glycoside hydrolase family 16 protein [Bacillus sp. es.034]|uniref:glycoside hydrolase family 16 protein n=1 Tax=Bacillus sp. es.034 TaxID=1761763 RepID=UPI000BF37698|nr:glycoside hydrolase family 16 protein [Bacillus sp. es.034]PFG04589.1 glycosyl hydrolase family 16 [Bacillus sp. es.034]
MLTVSGCSNQEDLLDSVKKKFESTEGGTKESEVMKREVELPPKALSAEEKEESPWSLVWNDDFDSYDFKSRWNLQDWASDKNEELQYYSPDNLKIRDGHLVIQSKKERFKERNYTSGAITTEDLFEFTYGKVEIRAKIPEGTGIFPALWLVNSNSEKWLPEIDIMENIGQVPNEIYFVVHWTDSNGEKQRDYSTYISETNFSDDFHTYGLIWEKDNISWTLDGEVVFETKMYSPDTPLFLYINTAIGGTWPGPPDPNDSSTKEFLIDYVRVYQANSKER